MQSSWFTWFQQAFVLQKMPFFSPSLCYCKAKWLWDLVTSNRPGVPVTCSSVGHEGARTLPPGSHWWGHHTSKAHAPRALTISRIYLTHWNWMILPDNHLALCVLKRKLVTIIVQRGEKVSLQKYLANTSPFWLQALKKQSCVYLWCIHAFACVETSKW